MFLGFKSPPIGLKQTSAGFSLLMPYGTAVGRVVDGNFDSTLNNLVIGSGFKMGAVSNTSNIVLGNTDTATAQAFAVTVTGSSNFLAVNGNNVAFSASANTAWGINNVVAIGSLGSNSQPGSGSIILGQGYSSQTNGVAIGAAAVIGAYGSICIGGGAGTLATDGITSGGGGGGGIVIVRNASGGPVSWSGTNSINIISGLTDAKTSSGTNSVNLNYYSGTSNTTNGSVLISGAGRLGGGTSAALTNCINILSGGASSSSFGGAGATNIIAIGSSGGMGSVAIYGKVQIQAQNGIGDGLSENFYVQFFGQTTSATATELFLDYSTNTKRLLMPTNIQYAFRTTITARQTGGTAGTVGDSSMWVLTGLIKQIASVATTAIVGSVTSTLIAQDAAASAWTVSHTADTTNGALKLTVSGDANKNLDWHAKTEVISLQ